MLNNLLKKIFIDDKLKNDVDFLSGVKLFSGVSRHSLAKIALITFKKKYVKGETIYDENNPADVFYIIKEGEVKLAASIGHKNITAGGFFGETALINGAKRDASAVALTNSQLYLIYRVKFDDMVENDSHAGLKIMRNLVNALAGHEI